MQYEISLEAREFFDVTLDKPPGLYFIQLFVQDKVYTDRIVISY